MSSTLTQSLPAPTIVQLAQGSPEWLAYRLHKFNASESAAVLGVSPWQTPYQLWLQKTGRSEGTKSTHAMLRGIELEPAARAAYEEHYVIQVQHQLMVSRAQSVHLWVFDGSLGLLHEVHRDEACMACIQAAWKAFAVHLDTDTPPPLSEADTVQRLDAQWSVAAKGFAEAKAVADQAAERLEAARQALLALVKHPKDCGAGVAVTRYWRQGNVDYKKIPALKGLDLSPWRGKSREEVRVTVASFTPDSGEKPCESGYTANPRNKKARQNRAKLLIYLG